VGVGDPAMAEKMAGVLTANGARHVMVVFGHDGLDELTTTARSTVVESRGGELRVSEVEAATLGLAPARPDQLKGGDAATNADLARRVLEGQRGPHRDIVVLNAAAALVVGGMAGDLGAGVQLAAAAVDDGRAAAALERLVACSRALSA
jgi:anthranilate phosphoribosyltransferase